jgi:hypothetical protein
VRRADLGWYARKNPGWLKVNGHAAGDGRNLARGYPLDKWHRLEVLMRDVLRLVVAAAVLGTTQGNSEEVGLRVSVRAVDDAGVMASLNACYGTNWNIDAIKEGESELPAMIAMIERNREDRERKVVIDR